MAEVVTDLEVVEQQAAPKLAEMAKLTQAEEAVAQAQGAELPEVQE
jgi:hypothetical protein